MKRLITLSFFFYLVVFLVSCHDDEEPKIKASRTVLMYLVADNSISDDIYPNIASVEEGLKNAETPGTFVIYWDGGKYYRSEFPQPTLFKYEVGEDGKVSDRVIIQTYNEQNSLSQDVMLDVFKDVEELCPAECYGLIFGSHATGWLPVDHSRTRSFGDDGGLKIDIPDLADVLARTSILYNIFIRKTGTHHLRRRKDQIIGTMSKFICNFNL